MPEELSTTPTTNSSATNSSAISTSTVSSTQGVSPTTSSEAPKKAEDVVYLPYGSGEGTGDYTPTPIEPGTPTSQWTYDQYRTLGYSPEQAKYAEEHGGKIPEFRTPGASPSEVQMRDRNGSSSNILERYGVGGFFSVSVKDVASGSFNPESLGLPGWSVNDPNNPLVKERNSLIQAARDALGTGNLPKVKATPGYTNLTGELTLRDLKQKTVLSPGYLPESKTSEKFVAVGPKGGQELVGSRDFSKLNTADQKLLREVGIDRFNQLKQVEYQNSLKSVEATNKILSRLEKYKDSSGGYRFSEAYDQGEIGSRELKTLGLSDAEISDIQLGAENYKQDIFRQSAALQSYEDNLKRLREGQLKSLGISGNPIGPLPVPSIKEGSKEAYLLQEFQKVAGLPDGSIDISKLYELGYTRKQIASVLGDLTAQPAAFSYNKYTSEVAAQKYLTNQLKATGSINNKGEIDLVKAIKGGVNPNLLVSAGGIDKETVDKAKGKAGEFGVKLYVSGGGNTTFSFAPFRLPGSVSTEVTVTSGDIRGLIPGVSTYRVFTQEHDKGWSPLGIAKTVGIGTLDLASAVTFLKPLSAAGKVGIAAADLGKGGLIARAGLVGQNLRAAAMAPLAGFDSPIQKVASTSLSTAGKATSGIKLTSRIGNIATAGLKGVGKGIVSGVGELTTPVRPSTYKGIGKALTGSVAIPGTSAYKKGVQQGILTLGQKNALKSGVEAARLKASNALQEALVAPGKTAPFKTPQYFETSKATATPYGLIEPYESSGITNVGRRGFIGDITTRTLPEVPPGVNPKFLGMERNLKVLPEGGEGALSRTAVIESPVEKATRRSASSAQYEISTKGLLKSFNVTPVLPKASSIFRLSTILSKALIPSNQLKLATKLTTGIKLAPGTKTDIEVSPGIRISRVTGRPSTRPTDIPNLQSNISIPVPVNPLNPIVSPIQNLVNKTGLISQPIIISKPKNTTITQPAVNIPNIAKVSTRVFPSNVSPFRYTPPIKDKPYEGSKNLRRKSRVFPTKKGVGGVWNLRPELLLGTNLVNKLGIDTSLEYGSIAPKDKKKLQKMLSKGQLDLTQYNLLTNSPESRERAPNPFGMSLPIGMYPMGPLAR